LLPPDLEFRIVQSIASRHTDYMMAASPSNETLITFYWKLLITSIPFSDCCGVSTNWRQKVNLPTQLPTL